MEVFFYCSYEHSQKGFYMTRLARDELIPAADIPADVESFFSYDRFQVLWRDLCDQQDRSLLKPQPNGGFLGLRNITGALADGRRATVNLAFSAGLDEMVQLRRIALTILGDYPEFCGLVLQWLSIGGPCSYQLNVEAFRGWMEQCAGATRLKRLADPRSLAGRLLPYLQRVDEPRIETELLRLAVYTSSWKDVAVIMGQGLVWKLKHPCALTPDMFTEAFIRQAPLWELAAEA